MKSKLIVNLDAEGKPCITAVTPFETPGFASTDFNLADRTLKMFFENLGPDSIFLGVIRNPDIEDGKLRTIVPLTIPEVIEWLVVFLRKKFEGNEFGSDEVLALSKKLQQMYFNEGEFGPDYVSENGPETC